MIGAAILLVITASAIVYGLSNYRDTDPRALVLSPTGDLVEARFLDFAKDPKLLREHAGSFYYGTNGKEKDVQFALSLYEEAAKRGDADAAGFLAFHHMEVDNSGTGRMWFERAADLGHVPSQKQLAKFFATGEWFNVDQAAAARWYRAASDAGDVESKVELALLYEQGAGVERSYEEAFDLFLGAANQGDQYAEYRVGLAYELGEGTTQDTVSALSWYQKGIAKGYAGALVNAGRIYFRGDLGVPDVPRAIALITEAAKQGDHEAQFMLGYIYQSDKASPRSLATSYAWLNLAAAGDPDAIQLRDAVKAQLNTYELQEAQAASRAWRVGSALIIGQQEGMPPRGSESDQRSTPPVPAATNRDAPDISDTSCTVECRSGTCTRTFANGHVEAMAVPQGMGQGQFVYSSSNCTAEHATFLGRPKEPRN